MNTPLKSLFASDALGALTLPPTKNVCARGSLLLAGLFLLDPPLLLVATLGSALKLIVVVFVVTVIVFCHSSTVPKAE